MAPELFGEGGVHSFASDLWALGCVMYECAAGRPPVREFVPVRAHGDDSHRRPASPPTTKKPPSRPEFENLAARVSWTRTRPDDSIGTVCCRTRSGPSIRQSRVNFAPSERRIPSRRNPRSRLRRDARGKPSDAAETPDRDAEGTGGGERGGGGDARGGDVGGAAAAAVMRGVETSVSAAAAVMRGVETSVTETPVTETPRDGDAGARASESTRRRRVRSQEVTRLSLAARANLEREEGGAYLSRDGSVDGGDAPAGDVALADADAELNFADASAGRGRSRGGRAAGQRGTERETAERRRKRRRRRRAGGEDDAWGCRRWGRDRGGPGGGGGCRGGGGGTRRRRARGGGVAIEDAPQDAPQDARDRAGRSRRGAGVDSARVRWSCVRGDVRGDVGGARGCGRGCGGADEPPDGFAGEAHRAQPTDRGGAGAALRRLGAAVRAVDDRRHARGAAGGARGVPHASTDPSRWLANQREGEHAGVLETLCCDTAAATFSSTPRS